MQKIITTLSTGSKKGENIEIRDWDLCSIDPCERESLVLMVRSVGSNMHSTVEDLSDEGVLCFEKVRGAPFDCELLVAVGVQTTCLSLLELGN